MSSIHGHEVLQMMIKSNKCYTKASLISEIEQQFGVDARFHTCSKEAMTAQALVDFRESKGKFVPLSDGFTTEEAKICHH
mgnify:FL=1